MKDDEHHLQTISYKRDETRSECEEGKGDKLMEGNIREWTLRSTFKEAIKYNKRSNKIKLLKS